MSEAEALWMLRQDLVGLGATPQTLAVFDELPLYAVAKILHVAIRIGVEWHDQEGISGARLDELADATSHTAAHVGAPRRKQTLTPTARARLDQQVAQAVERAKNAIASGRDHIEVVPNEPAVDAAACRRCGRNDLTVTTVAAHERWCMSHLYDDDGELLNK